MTVAAYWRRRIPGFESGDNVRIIRATPTSSATSGGRGIRAVGPDEAGVNVSNARSTLMPWPIISFVTALILALFLSGAAHGQTPFFGVDEVYSNGDGSVQFIVMNNAGSTHLAGQTIVASGSSTHTFTFPSDLPAGARNHTFLVATQGFANLGLVTPDYVIPNGFLFVPFGSVSIGGNRTPYRDLPTDGVNAIWFDGDGGPDVVANAVATNFAGQTYQFTSEPSAVPHWVPTGNLNVARINHTATLLANGKVLVAGGSDSGGNALESAELYDPNTGTWSVTGHSNAGHAGHTATLLPDGRVLVVGGVNLQDPLDFAELYDPGTGTWSRTGSPLAGRFDHTATLLHDGKVLVAGGASAGFVTTAALYDPATGAWSSAGSLTIPRSLHQATLLQDGRILVTGGTNDADYAFPLSAAELYDPVAGTWSAASSLNTSRDLHSATLLPSGRVLVAGGNGPPNQNPPGCATRPVATCTISDVPTNAAEIFDPSTGRWSNTGSLNVGHVGHTATLLPSGEVIVAGGGGSLGAIQSAELYDASSALWRITAALNIARAFHTATLLQNGTALVAGGISAAGALNSAEIYGVAFPPGAIDPGFTGAWFDPAQNGHGLFVEVLPNNRLLAWWFTFNPAGTEQAWFGGVGTYSGNTATISQVNETTGGRWIPNFDAKQIANNPWGTLTFTFTDRDHGKVNFGSVLGYGTGSLNLSRLTQPVMPSAVASSIGPPGAVAVDTSGNTYFSSPSIVFKRDKDGFFTRLAGNGSGGYSGDGGQATQALLNFPAIYPELAADPIDWSELAGGLATDSTGNVYVADGYNHRVRKIDSNGIITTVAGDGSRATSGDGGLATRAQLGFPQSIAVDSANNLYISHWNALRKVTPGGLITTLTGPNCGSGYLGPGLCAPEGIALDAQNNVYAADGYCRVRKVGSDHSVTTVAGDDRHPDGHGLAFTCGYSGDGGVATSAALETPYGVATDARGDLFIADTYNHCVRKVDASGIISTVVGTCRAAGYSGDGGPAASARLNLPHGVAVDPVGNLYIADTGNNRVRSVSPIGTITTVAGNGSAYVASPPGTIGVGTTGAWFDPSQNGHGLFVEVLPGNRFLAWWFTFNPAGTQQAWFGGVGTYSGNTAMITDVNQTTGGRWIPNFNPSQIVNNHWGTLTFTFTDCNHGRVDFNSMLGYGSGSMNLMRLTQPTGMSCM